MVKEIFCAYGVDVDAVGGWLGSYGGEDSPCDISRGVFSGEVGSMRLLRMFERFDMKTTWFIPGHSIESFPKQMKEVAKAGHEIAMHGWIHENNSLLGYDDERDLMRRAFDTLAKASDIEPVGFRSANWDIGRHTMRSPGLEVPHPRLHLRAFVLVPLHALAPCLQVPGRGPVAGLLARVSRAGVARLEHP